MKNISAMISAAAVALVLLANIPTVSKPDTELSATERETSVVNRTGGRRRLSFIQRARQAIARRLYSAAQRRRDR